MDKINEITRDCFNALTQIRHLDERSQPMPEVLYQRMSTFIQRAMDQAHQEFGPQDAQDITYAIVALTDEVVLSKGGALRDYWLSNLLQLRFFNENIAGENFFVRLSQLLAQPQRQQVLRVYYLSLLFGFQGRYRVRGGEVELAHIIEQAGGVLARQGQLQTPALTPPEWVRPKENISAASQHKALLWISVAAVVLSIGLYIGLKVSLDSQADDLTETVNSILETQ